MTITLDDQIREVGQRWARAETTGDIAALADLVTEDFQLVGPYGFVLDRTQWLDRYRSGDLVTTSLSWRDVQMHRYADTVVAIGTQTQHAAYRGTPADGVFRVSHVFVRVRDRWMIAHIQLSLGSPPSTP